MKLFLAFAISQALIRTLTADSVAPSGDVSKDLKTNLDYVRVLLAKA